jgi:hypothetical protein
VAKKNAKVKENSLAIFQRLSVLAVKKLPATVSKPSTSFYPTYFLSSRSNQKT